MLKVLRNLFKQKDPVSESISVTNQHIIASNNTLMEAIIEQQNQIKKATEGYDKYFEELLAWIREEEAV